MKNSPLILNYALPQGVQFGCEDTTAWDSHPELRNLDKSPLLDPAGRMRTLYLRIETVNVCNNDCIICAYGDQSRPKKRMSPELFGKVLADYQEMGGGYVSLTPLVGDVFMDSQLDERIAYMQECDFVTGIGFTTNAVMAHRLSDEKLRAIVTPLKHLSISIYGLDQEEYEAMTRKNTYREMIDSIRRILSIATFPVTLSFRALKTRTETELLDWLKTELGVAPEEIGPEKGRHRISINSFIGTYGNWGKYSKENRPLPYDAVWGAFERQPVRPQCMIPLLAFLVFSNGNVSFCNCDNFDDTEELRLGNVNDDTLSNIYNNAKTKSLWNWAQSGVPAFCQNCSFHIPMSFLSSRPDTLTNPYGLVGAG
jgi:MoaA/NifB/PqqE/SkfB family radical SAM enzyme